MAARYHMALPGGFFSGLAGCKITRSLFTPPLLFFLAAATAAIHDRYILFHEPAMVPLCGTFILMTLSSLPLVLRSLAPGRIPLFLLISLIIIVPLVIPGDMPSRAVPVKGAFNGTVMDVTSRGTERECLLETGEKADRKRILAHFPSGYRPMRGDRVLFYGTLQPVEWSGSREYSLVRQGILYRAWLDRDRLVLTQGNRTGVDAILLSMEKTLEETYSGATRGLLAALLLSDRQWLSRDDYSRFREAGLLHALAASGMHVGILVALPFFIAGIAGTGKRFLPFIMLPLVILYLALCGFPVSLARASVMFAIVAVQDASALRRNTANALFLSGTVLLVAGPWQLFDVSFQLSFCATLGIIVLYSPFKRLLKGLPAILRAPMAMTLSAMIWIIPLTMLHFGEINMSGIIAGIPAVPLITLLMITSIILTPLVTFMPAAGLTIPVMDTMASLIMKITAVAADFPGHFTMESLSPLLILPCVVILLLLASGHRLGRFALPLLTLALVSAWAIMALKAGSLDPSMTVYRGSKGNVLLMREGRTILIAGPLTEEVATDLLKDARIPGIRSIDIYIPSACPETLKTSLRVARSLGADRCYLTDGAVPDGSLYRFLAGMEESSIPVELVSFFPEKNTARCFKSIDGKPSMGQIFVHLARTLSLTDELIEGCSLSPDMAVRTRPRDKYDYPGHSGYRQVICP